MMSAGGGKGVLGATDRLRGVGNYSGSPTGVGSAAAPGGIPSGKAIRRDLAISGGPTILEATDDTDDSAADFDVLDPQPRNSLGQTGSTTTTHIGATTTTGPTTTTVFGATTTVVPTTTTTLACAPFGITAAQCVLRSRAAGGLRHGNLVAQGHAGDRGSRHATRPRPRRRRYQRGTRLIKRRGAAAEGKSSRGDGGDEGQPSAACAVPLVWTCSPRLAAVCFSTSPTGAFVTRRVRRSPVPRRSYRRRPRPCPDDGAARAQAERHAAGVMWARLYAVERDLHDELRTDVDDAPSRPISSAMPAARSASAACRRSCP